MKYTYAFTVWPDETRGFNRAVFDTFRAMVARIEMAFTPDDFERYRSAMSHHGLTLREIERVPYVEPEAVL